MPRSPLTVLHLSDVQFGMNHRFAGAEAVGPDELYNTLLARVIEDLTSLRDEDNTRLRPDLLLLTGDLAERGRKSEFDDALQFVGGLTEFLGLGRNQVVLVPGNHDVNRHLCASYFESCAGNDERPEEPFWPKWSHFVSMFRQFYGDTPGVSMTADQPWSFFEVPNLEVVVAGLNSTMKESHRQEDHYGWVGEAQLHWFAGQLEPYRERGWWRFAAVHHNVRRAPVRDDENLRDEERFRARLGPLVHAIFHGHTHDGKLDWLNHKVPIFATGSAAVKADAQPPEIPNQYQVVQLWPNCFKRWTRTYVPAQLRWVGDTRASERGDSWLSMERLTFDLPPARPAGMAGNGEVALSVHHEIERPQDDLLGRIDRICRLRERNHAQIERLTVGRPPLEYLRVSAGDDLFQRVYAVGAIAGQVTVEQLDLFLRRVHQRYLEDDPGTRSILIATGIIPPSLLDAARRQHVDLVSLAEFQGLLDLRPYLAKQMAELATDSAYDPALYIPQRLQFEEGHELKEATDAVDAVWHWLQDPRGRFVVILGDNGTGKTFLLRQLARRIAADDPGIFPILIQMRSLERSHSLEELLSQHFGRLGMDFSPAKFRYMLEQGRVILLADGFDELAVRTTYHEAARQFDTLLQAGVGAAKVVITSRRQHFSSDEEAGMHVGTVGTVAGRKIGLLQPFDRGQIDEFLKRSCAGAEMASWRLKLIERVETLMGLSENPRLLRFVVDLPQGKLEDAAGGRGTVRLAEIYQLLLDRWLVNEEQRVALKVGSRNLTHDDRLRAATALALLLWEKASATASLAEIEEEAAEIVQTLKEGSLDPETAAFQIGSGTFFVRDERGRFSFVHQSILEWLVAREAACELAAGRGARMLLGREMSPLMVEFFCDLAGSDAAAAWARAALAALNTPEATQTNARQILRSLGEGVARFEATLAFIKGVFPESPAFTIDLYLASAQQMDIRRSMADSARLVTEEALSYGSRLPNELKADVALPPWEAELLTEMFAPRPLIFVQGVPGCGKTSTLSFLMAYCRRLPWKTGEGHFGYRHVILPIDLQDQPDDLKQIGEPGNQRQEQSLRLLAGLGDLLDRLLESTLSPQQLSVVVKRAFFRTDRELPATHMTQTAAIRRLMAVRLKGMQADQELIWKSVRSALKSGSVHDQVVAYFLLLQELANIQRLDQGRPLIVAIDGLDYFPQYLQLDLLRTLETVAYGAGERSLSIVVIGRLSTATRHSGTLDGLDAYRIHFQGPDPVDLVFFRLSTVLLNPRDADRWKNIPDSERDDLRRRMWYLWEQLVNPASQFSRLLSGLAGTNGRLGYRFARWWLTSPRLTHGRAAKDAAGEGLVEQPIVFALLLRFAQAVAREISVDEPIEQIDGWEELVADRFFRRLLGIMIDNFIVRTCDSQTGKLPHARALLGDRLREHLAGFMTDESAAYLRARANAPVAAAVYDACRVLTRDNSVERSRRLERALKEKERTLRGRLVRIVASDIFLAQGLCFWLIEGAVRGAAATSRGAAEGGFFELLPNQVRCFKRAPRPTRWESESILLSPDSRRTRSAINIFSADGKTLSPVALHVLCLLEDSEQGVEAIVVRNRLKAWGFDDHQTMQALSDMLDVDHRLIFATKAFGHGLEGWADSYQRIVISSAGSSYLKAVAARPAYIQWALLEPRALYEQLGGEGIEKLSKTMSGRLELVLKGLHLISADESDRLRKLSWVDFERSLSPLSWIFFPSLRRFIRDSSYLRGSKARGIGGKFLAFANELRAERVEAFGVFPEDWDYCLADAELEFREQFGSEQQEE